MTEEFDKRNLKAHDPEVTTTLQVWDYMRDAFNDRAKEISFDIRGFQMDRNSSNFELSFVKRFDKKSGRMQARAGRLNMTWSTLKELHRVLSEYV